MAVVLSSISIGNMSYSSEPTKHDASELQFEVQTTKVVHETFYLLLSDEGVRMNGLRRGKEPKFSDRETESVHKALHGACKRLLDLHSEEIRAEVDTLDISPSALCTSYHLVASGLFEDGCNWGKVVMLFCASSLLAARIYRNGQSTSVESIEKWLNTFILQNLKHWIKEHRGWGGLPDKFSPDKLQRDVAPVRTDTKSWWPVAAATLGLSAAVGLAVIGSR